jgi:hypothetical protein
VFGEGLRNGVRPENIEQLDGERPPLPSLTPAEVQEHAALCNQRHDLRNPFARLVAVGLNDKEVFPGVFRFNPPYIRGAILDIGEWRKQNVHDPEE